MSEAVREQLDEAMRRGYVAAYRWLRNPDESRDACQEAAVRALKAGDRYDPSRPFYPWFYRILKNHCFDRIKKRRRFTGQSEEPAASEDVSAERAMLLNEREQAVSRCIAELDNDLREVIELRHFQDASYEEIADVVGCPIGTVMSRLYRARKALRKKLMTKPGFAGHRARGGS